MTRRARIFIVAGTVALVAAGPMFAAPSVEVPDGCEGFLTVQMKGCGVSHYWRCAADSEGNVWEVHYDFEGPFSMSVYDSEFQWLDSRYFSDGSREYLLEPGPDPASLTELLETGSDRYAFTMRETGPDGERDVVHQGQDTLTGREVVIDGETLLETEFSAAAMDAVSGEEVYSVSGNQYVMRDERLFFLGPDTYREGIEERDNDLSPVRFIRPGEKGFGVMTPQYECTASEDIGFTPAPAAQPQEMRNDDL
ncbi:hypothetical protein [Tropicimonas isoalkanivorans]|uniref:Uncharacterized protein n=1 Tax=Tropicimonas isoalkanivorans TaxID=441112 RepID=A0A1I1LY52_9RHOB|nr:hypothetical protein [Tropicimonas isoalkanivorans]SFC77402.1 hypothetical protein SAMN04488094_10947 [Tropicimonas isoalkanivorans]